MAGGWYEDIVSEHLVEDTMVNRNVEKALVLGIEQAGGPRQLVDDGHFVWSGVIVQR